MMVILFCVYDSLKHRRFFVISIVFFRKSIYNNGIECKIPDHEGQTKKDGCDRPFCFVMDLVTYGKEWYNNSI